MRFVHNLPDLDSEDKSNIEFAEAVMKQSTEICSLMFGKMFYAFDHALLERTNMQQMINKYCALLGEYSQLSLNVPVKQNFVFSVVSII